MRSKSAGTNGEKVSVASALNCCDGEATGHVATTGGTSAEDAQDPMVATSRIATDP